MTGLFEHRLITEGWRSTEAKNKDDREPHAWVSPEGKWYNCPYLEHHMFAMYVVRELKPERLPKNEYVYGNTHYERAKDILSEIGWILIHGDIISGIIIHNRSRMTRKQYLVLLDYFGDTRLFRGWRIKDMWNEIIEQRRQED